MTAVAGPSLSSYFHYQDSTGWILLSIGGMTNKRIYEVERTEAYVPINHLYNILSYMVMP